MRCLHETSTAVRLNGDVNNVNNNITNNSIFYILDKYVSIYIHINT